MQSRTRRQLEKGASSLSPGGRFAGRVPRAVFRAYLDAWERIRPSGPMAPEWQDVNALAAQLCAERAGV